MNNCSGLSKSHSSFPFSPFHFTFVVPLLRIYRHRSVSFLLFTLLATLEHFLHLLIDYSRRKRHLKPSWKVKAQKRENKTRKQCRYRKLDIVHKHNKKQKQRKTVRRETACAKCTPHNHRKMCEREKKREKRFYEMLVYVALHAPQPLIALSAIRARFSYNVV